MNDPENTFVATPLPASALVLQDGTIVSLAAGHRPRRAYAALILRFFAMAWRNMTAGAVAGLLLGVLLMWLLPSTYRAKTVIEPSPVAQSLDQQGRLSSLVSGSVRSLLSADSALPQMTKDFLQLLDSNVVAATLIKDPRIAAQIFPTSWDPATQSFREPQTFRHAIGGFARSLLGLPRWTPPGPEMMHGYIDRHLTISPIGDGTLQELSLQTNNAKWSAYLLDRMVKTADQYLREREARRSQASIDYWQKELNGATAQDVRAALIANIVDAKRRIVFAGINLPFAVDIDDPVIVPQIPSGPSPLAVILGSLSVGVLLSLLPLLWSWAKEFRRSSNPDVGMQNYV